VDSGFHAMAFVCMNNMIDKTLWLFSTIFYILHL